MNNTKLLVSKGMANSGDVIVPEGMGSVMRQLACGCSSLKRMLAVAVEPLKGEVAMERAVVLLMRVETPLSVTPEEKT